MHIKYYGKCFSGPDLRIPGWAGDGASTSFQFWTDKKCTDAAMAGMELIYPYEDAVVPGGTSSFVKVSDLFYLLEIEAVLKTPDKCSSLVVPHYRFYTDHSWETPIPVALMIDTDWWPNHLNVMFRLPPPGYNSVFRKGEPFAQVVFVPRCSLRLEEMSETDVAKNKELQIHINNLRNLATREWTTSLGFVQNNLYEVLSHLERQNKLPFKVKKFKIVT